MKLILSLRKRTLGIVTPCVGVWIETIKHNDFEKKSQVTPCVGVWIETTVEDES